VYASVVTIGYLCLGVGGGGCVVEA